MIICCSCESAVIPQKVTIYFASKLRQSISPEHRVLISEAVLRLPDLATQQQDVSFPLALGLPVRHLAVFHDAYQCTFDSDAAVPCIFVAKKVREIRSHCHKSHGWVKSNAVQRGPLATAYSPTPNNDDERLKERLR